MGQVFGLYNLVKSRNLVEVQKHLAAHPETIDEKNPVVIPDRYCDVY
jgi:hypothetical protein